MVSFGLHDVVECGYDPKVVTKHLMVAVRVG